MSAKLVDTETGEVVEIAGVHPVAAMFPMLDDESLDALAEDIEQNGLIDPIQLLPDGTMVDGRNRWAAAERRSLVVECVIAPIADPVTFILSKNIARRNITKGQQAMIVAAACFGTKQTVRDAAKQHGVPSAQVAKGNTILKVASDLVDNVIAGVTSLDTAYKEAQDRKAAQDSVVKRLARLREAAPDLAAKVDDEVLSLSDAEGAHAERDRKAAEQQRDARNLLTKVLTLLVPDSPVDGHAEAWASRLGDLDPEVIGQLDKAIALLSDLRKRVAR